MVLELRLQQEQAVKFLLWEQYHNKGEFTMRTLTVKRGYNRYYSAIFIIAACVCFFSISGFAYFSWSKFVTKQDIQQRIAEIIDQTLQKGEGTVDGVKFYTKVPTSSEFVEEVKRYGEEAIPVLAEHLNSQDARQRTLAVELLGHIGHPGILVHLQKIIRDDSSLTLKVIALRWVAQMDDEKAKDVVKEASEIASEKEVREEAQQLLGKRHR
jgi:hypothetical protein